MWIVWGGDGDNDNRDMVGRGQHMWGWRQFNGDGVVSSFPCQSLLLYTENSIKRVI